MNTQFFSDIYLKFTHLYAQNLVREEDEPRVPEKVIRCVWNDQLLNTEDLRTTDGKKLKKKQKLVGPDRSREITINIGIPIGLIYARASKPIPLERALGRLFHTKSAPGDQWLRFMKHYILGNKDRMWKLLKSDQQTQGLMQVYQDYCTKNENNCLRCQFPKVVDQYFS